MVKNWPMRLIGRIGAELHTRGVLGFLRFVATRIWQYRKDVLFELMLTEREIPSDGQGAKLLENVVMVGRQNLGSAETLTVEQRVLPAQNDAYRVAVETGDLLFAVVTSDGDV